MVIAASRQLSPTPSKSVQLHFSYFAILWFDKLRVLCMGVMCSDTCFRLLWQLCGGWSGASLEGGRLESLATIKD